MQTVERNNQQRATLDSCRYAPIIIGDIGAYTTHAPLFFEYNVIRDADLSPISGLVSDDVVRNIVKKFGKILTSLILDGCHLLTAEVLHAIASATSLRGISFKWS